ncbi:RNA polymerase sporulation sigma factor SigH [Lachnospiraceae bacterium LCP25S3_G4]
MNNYKTLADEELIKNLREGDASITDYIMDKYKYLVRKKAKAMYLLGGDNDDLIQEGMIGLFKAVRDYDISQDSTFYSFAELCISRQMYSAIEASKRKKHLPLNSYVSIYDEGDEDSAEGKPPLIDTIQSEKLNNPEELFLNKEYLEIIETKLKEGLSDLENRVLYLHLLGTDYQTIARLLDKSPKAIDNALQRIKGKAAKIII